jgi:hypothetical protein
LRIVPQPHASPFSHRIVDAPRIDVFLWHLWLVGKRIKLLYSSNLARPCPDTFIDVPCLGLVCKVETDKGEVSAAQANGRGLSGCRRRWSERAESDDGVRDPELTRASCLHSSSTIAGSGRVDEYEMVWRQVERADDLFTAARKRHIFNLPGISLSFQSKGNLIQVRVPSQSESFP